MSLVRRVRAFVRRHLSLYPPYLGASIRVSTPEPGAFRVEMPLQLTNRNLVGTHFGGSLYSMCDPFHMILLMEKLGPDYIVWDKAATIRFLKPGRGRVKAEFRIPDERVEEIRRAADARRKVEPTFEVEVVDEDGQVVARVEKLLYVRRREPGRA